MAVYKYSALGKTGELIKGSYQATDKSTVVTMIKNKGHIPLEVKEKMGLSFLENRSIKSGVSIRELAVFCRQFVTVIEAGIPILECVDIIRKQTESKRLKEILNRVYEQVQKGRTLSDSLKEFKDVLPPILINMIESGESSGTLEKVMGRLATYFENEGKIINKVKGAMVYPIVVFAVAIVAVMGLLWGVVPQFKSMYDGMGVELPLSTRALITMGDFMANYWYIVILGLGGIIGGLIAFFKRDTGKRILDNFYYTAPVISKTYKKIVAARFSRTLASLTGAGLPLIQSLEITDRVIANTRVSKYMVEMIEEVSKGTKLSTAIGGLGIFPTMIFNMVNIGEESGSLDTILDKTADFFEDEADTAIEGLTRLVEPAIIVILAVVVGIVIISIVSPMFGIFQNVSNM